MTAAARAAEPVPQYWTAREPGEPVASWVARMALAYAAGRPAVLTRLARAEAAERAAPAAVTTNRRHEMTTEAYR